MHNTKQNLVFHSAIMQTLGQTDKINMIYAKDNYGQIMEIATKKDLSTYIFNPQRWFNLVAWFKVAILVIDSRCPEAHQSKHLRSAMGSRIFFKKIMKIIRKRNKIKQTKNNNKITLY